MQLFKMQSTGNKDWQLLVLPLPPPPVNFYLFVIYYFFCFYNFLFLRLVVHWVQGSDVTPPVVFGSPSLQREGYGFSLEGLSL